MSETQNSFQVSLAEYAGITGPIQPSAFQEFGTFLIGPTGFVTISIPFQVATASHIVVLVNDVDTGSLGRIGMTISIPPSSTPACFVSASNTPYGATFDVYNVGAYKYYITGTCADTNSVNGTLDAVADTIEVGLSTGDFISGSITILYA